MTKTKVIYWKRKFFSISVINPFLYKFVAPWGDLGVEADTIAPTKFLRIPSTIWFEYGGTHDEAVKDLTEAGFTDIMEVDEL